MQLKVGDILKIKGSDDKYIFLGFVEKGQRDPIVEWPMDYPKVKFGWFTPFPLKLNGRGNESEIPVFAWLINMLEKIDYDTNNI